MNAWKLEGCQVDDCKGAKPAWLAGRFPGRCRKPLQRDSCQMISMDSPHTPNALAGGTSPKVLVVVQVVICAKHADKADPPSYRPPPPPSDAKMEAAVATAKAAGLPTIKTKGIFRPDLPPCSF